MPFIPVALVEDGGSTPFVQIFDSTLGSDAASFDVTGIPGTYSALRWIITGRGSAAAAQVEVRLQMNNDSGSSYEYQRMFAHTGNNIAGTQGTPTYCFIGEFAADTATAGRAATLEGFIHNYAGTTYNKTFHVNGGRVAALHLWESTLGAWLSTDAITRLTFFLSSGDFKAGTRLTVWGIV